MRSAIKNDKLDELIERIEKESTAYRKIINDIVLYTDGAYNIKDLYIMPMYFINEILERIESKREKEREEIERSKGRQITHF